MSSSQPPVKDYEDFKRRLQVLPRDQQLKVLTKLYDLVYEKLDAQVWRTMATAIRHAKETGLEGHEDFQIDEKDLKKLSHIQDSARQKK